MDLSYPEGFFYEDDPEEIATDSVSFRSLKRMTAKERDAAIAAGVLGIQLYEWVEARFDLPEPQLLDLSYETNAEVAARSLRQFWRLGERPIANMLRILESKGLRVFSLAENTKNVDAFSFWHGDTPFIFLNNFKTAEHSIFDAAHELGHLTLHRHGGPRNSKSAEREANLFASAFLMPADDVRARMPRLIHVNAIIKAKERWRVSAMAMAHRLHSLELLSDWQYRSMCIELGTRGYRTAEPNGLERERSTVWQKVLAHLWSERTTKEEIARGLHLPMDELESLIFGLTGAVGEPERPMGKVSLAIVD